jgi:hypothetical protein
MPPLSARSFGGRRGAAGFPFDAPRISYWFDGRTALWNGVRSLGLVPGDEVLVPAYACGTEVEALLRAGLKMRFYHLDSALRPDPAELEALCDRGVRALFVIHYFGFPQPLDVLQAVCQRRGLLLIEDNAHGLFSCDDRGRPLGSVGDLGVFSLHKSLPLPDGGLAVLNREPVGDSTDPCAPATRSLLGRMRGLVETSIERRFPAAGAPWRQATDHVVALASRRGSRGASDEPEPRGEPYAFDPRRNSWRISALSALLLRWACPESVVTRRRRNYRILWERLEPGGSVVPLLPALPDGCCPLFFPLLQNGGPGLRPHLRGFGIETHGFGFEHPAIPDHGFAFEATLKRDVAALPVHQDLEAEEMARLADRVNDWNQRNRRR